MLKLQATPISSIILPREKRRDIKCTHKRDACNVHHNYTMLDNHIYCVVTSPKLHWTVAGTTDNALSQSL